MCPHFSKMCPQMCPHNIPDALGLQWTHPDFKCLSIEGKKKKSARLWTSADLLMVPGAGIEPALLSEGDFESPASTNFTTRAVMRR